MRYIILMIIDISKNGICDFFSHFIKVVGMILSFLWQIIVSFGSYLGVTEWITSHSIFCLVLLVASLLGFCLPEKSKKRILGWISDIVSFISWICSFVIKLTVGSFLFGV